MPPVVGAPVAPLQGARLAAVAERGGGHGRRRVEQQREVGKQGRLVVPHDQQVVAPRVEHLTAQRALAEERVPGQHPPTPVEASEQGRGDRAFRLGLVGGAVDRLLGQDDALLVAEGGEGVDRAAASLEAQPPALRLAVAGDPLAAPRLGIGRGTGLEVAAQGDDQPVGVQPREQPLERGVPACGSGTGCARPRTRGARGRPHLAAPPTRRSPVATAAAPGSPPPPAPAPRATDSRYSPGGAGRARRRRPPIGSAGRRPARGRLPGQPQRAYTPSCAPWCGCSASDTDHPTPRGAPLPCTTHA